MCLPEKLEIEDDPDKILLNKQSEAISQCPHWHEYNLKTLVNDKKDNTT